MPKMSPKRQIVKLLESRYDKGQAHVDFFERVASGKAIDVETDMPGLIKRVTPTLDQMMYARELLMAYQHGRPRNTLDVDVTDERPAKNFDALSVKELEDLERLTRKLKAPATSGAVVDGRVVDGRVVDGRVVDAAFQLTDGKPKP